MLFGSTVFLPIYFCLAAYLFMPCSLRSPGTTLSSAPPPFSTRRDIPPHHIAFPPLLGAPFPFTPLFVHVAPNCTYEPFGGCVGRCMPPPSFAPMPRPAPETAGIQPAPVHNGNGLWISKCRAARRGAPPKKKKIKTSPKSVILKSEKKPGFSQELRSGEVTGRRSRTAHVNFRRISVGDSRRRECKRRSRVSPEE